MVNHKFRVIVAEDEKLIAKNIATNIKRANEAFEVIYIAQDGSEAYEATSRFMPDVVFSDIKMPIMDGLALVKKINQEFPAVKTVIISGYDDFEYVRTALQHNTSDYLLKPINSDDLSKTLGKIEQELLATRKELSPRRQIETVDMIESIKMYLRYNLNRSINFSEIASEHGFTGAYLTKIFKKHTGISPIKYLIEYRIDIAKKLLIDTSLTIEEISMKTGFNDQFHFSKTFKKVTGMSPKLYRQKMTS